MCRDTMVGVVASFKAGRESLQADTCFVNSSGNATRWLTDWVDASITVEYLAY